MDFSDSSLIDEESQREVEALQDIHFSDEFIMTSGNESATQTTLPSNPPKPPTDSPIKKDDTCKKKEKPKMAYFASKLASIVLELNKWESSIESPTTSSTRPAAPQPLTVDEFMQKMHASIKAAASTPKRPTVTPSTSINSLANLDLSSDTTVPPNSSSADININLKRGSSAISGGSPEAKRSSYRHRYELCHNHPNCPLPCDCLCKRCILLHSDRVAAGCRCHRL